MKQNKIVFDFALPPQTAMLGDKAYCAWLALAGSAIGKSCGEPIVGPVAVKALVSTSERRGLERIATRVIDLLIAHGVVEAGAMADLTMRFDRTIEKGRVSVEVKPTRPPEMRLKAAARANVAEPTRTRWAAARASKHMEQMAAFIEK